MGLDLVELVMECEARFGVELPDEAFEGVDGTVGALAGVILAQLAQEPPGCHSARAFRRLRRTLVSTTPLDPRALRPSTRFGDVAPPGHRSRQWRALSRAHPSLPHHSRLPDLAGVTLGQLAKELTRYLPEPGEADPYAVVLEGVMKVTCDQAGTTRDRLSPRTHFIRDLGMD